LRGGERDVLGVLVVPLEPLLDERAHGDDGEPGVDRLRDHLAGQRAAEALAAILLTDLGVEEDPAALTVEELREAGDLAIDADLETVRGLGDSAHIRASPERPRDLPCVSAGLSRR